MTGHIKSHSPKAELERRLKIIRMEKVRLFNIGNERTRKEDIRYLQLIEDERKLQRRIDKR